MEPELLVTDGASSAAGERPFTGTALLQDSGRKKTVFSSHVQPGLLQICSSMGINWDDQEHAILQGGA